MKKIILSIFSMGLLMTSCDMDLNQPGTQVDTESIQTAADCKAYRNNVYASFRALTSGTYVTNTELEMDQFLGLFDNGSRGQYFANAQIFANNGDISDAYEGCYGVMKNINFMLPYAQNLIDGGTLTESEVQDVKRYIGEVKFFRAYIYYWLFDHYCQAYDESKADQEGLGCQIVLTYNPTGDTSSYPARSSMKETMRVINEDLADAYAALKEYEQIDNSNCAPNASYLSSYTVAALQARVALLSKDYATAASKAQEVIGGPYTLTEADSYIDMWEQDNGSELIMVPYVDANESAYVGSFFNAWNYTVSWPVRVDYLPTFETLAAYDDGDIRLDAFFVPLNQMQIGDQVVGAFVFYKFPGNDALQSGSNEFKNKPKPFRLSEQYLILAEATAMDGAAKNEQTSNSALNTLRAARIDGWEEARYSGTQLISEIRAERAKELVGEGFRMSDLRRWNLGFTRDGSYPINPAIENLFISTNVAVSFSAGDYRYVWPIPQHQMEINPQLKGQQNPGY